MNSDKMQSETVMIKIDDKVQKRIRSEHDTTTNLASSGLHIQEGAPARLPCVYVCNRVRSWQSFAGLNGRPTIEKREVYAN